MKPRIGARVDDVQPNIVAALRAAGAKVEILDVGREGVPDLLAGWLGSLSLLECKARLGKLSEAQLRERDLWASCGVQVHRVTTPREALAAIGLAPEAIARRLEAMRELRRTLTPRKELSKGRLQSSVRPAP